MGSCVNNHAMRLNKLRIGTKKTGLTHSVVLLTHPEWSIVTIKRERIFTFVQDKDTVMVLQSIQPFFLCKRYRGVGKNTFPPQAALPTMNQS